MKIQRSLLAKPYLLCLATALILVTPVASAQDSKPASEQGSTSSLQKTQPTETSGGNQAPALPQGQEALNAADEELFDEPLQVGDATQGLLAWQRSGEISSATARSIEGAVANRSYDRYLKSFEFPIPERMTSSVKSTSGSAGK